MSDHWKTVEKLQVNDNKFVKIPSEVLNRISTKKKKFRAPVNTVTEIDNIYQLNFKANADLDLSSQGRGRMSSVQGFKSQIKKRNSE